MHIKASAKGHIVIPAEIRRKLGIEEGTRTHVQVDEENRSIVLTPITREFVQSLRGSHRGSGVLKALEAERRRSRDEE